MPPHITYSSSDLDISRRLIFCKINPLELRDNKTVRFTEFFKRLEISATSIWYDSVKSMTAYLEKHLH